MQRAADRMSGAFNARAPYAHGGLCESALLFAVAVLAVALSASQLFAGEAEVVGAEARQTSDGVWSFDVTVQHADEGWDHYADLWQVIGPDGSVLGERVLAHPHVDEQPFTRSLTGVDIPADVSEVKIVARDSVHGLNTKGFILPLR